MSQKIGPREQKLREMRAGRRAGVVDPAVLRRTKSLLASANLDAQATKGAAGAATREESAMSAKKQAKSKAEAKRAKAKKARSQARGTGRRDGKDRSPLAVGTFIVQGGEAGRSMAALEKQFGIKAHPMRSKIHAARHELGFTIDYDPKAKAYVGSAPKVGATVSDPAAAAPQDEG
jgi:hypothetical protein